MSARTLVKICGLREPAHALVAAEAGADLIGLVFYPPSSRFVTIPEARAVADAARGSNVRVTGLFVNEDADTINRTAEDVGLDFVQLSGNESPAIAAQIERPVISTIRADSSGRADEERRFQEWIEAHSAPWAILLDSHVPGMYGGTGTVADWFVATDFASRYRTILAGGLTPDTVAEAIRRVKPFAVDVSSGVETNGRKDPEKIRAFIAAAMSTSTSLAQR